MLRRTYTLRSRYGTASQQFRKGSPALWRKRKRRPGSAKGNPGAGAVARGAGAQDHLPPPAGTDDAFRMLVNTKRGSSR